MSTPDQTEFQILAALQDIETEWRSSDPSDDQCTRALKEVVGTAGEKRGYKVLANKCRFDADGEWLFDMVWLELHDNYVVRVPLVLESEWSNVELKRWDDFEKLCVARADHRVFVYWAPCLAKARDIAEQLLEGVRNFNASQSGDRYLLACWVEDSERFETRLYVTA